jgi:hypothetical protein
MPIRVRPYDESRCRPKSLKNRRLRFEIGYRFYSFLYGLKSANWRLTRINRNIVSQIKGQKINGTRRVHQLLSER